MSNVLPPICPRCGASLVGGSVDGLCAQCLGALNFATQTALPGEGSVRPAAALPIEELAPHFPHLEICECLGRGGMGVVYKTRQKSLNRLVALKLLAPERAGDPGFAERFAREARALAALNHPNIVAVHDFGQAGGFFYLLMEFVDGVNLRQAMNARRLTPEQALAVVPPVCEALQYAHEHGIVHRDIKPENLLLDKDGRIKIADFGIARMLGDDGVSLDAQPAGTPQYMAPEQKGHQLTDHRADIYSLGVVLYEMLTGELPTAELRPPLLRARGARMDARLDEIVLRALEQAPELRYQTATEMRTEVEAMTLGNPDSTGPASWPRMAWRFSRAALWSVVAVVVCGAVAGVLWLENRPRGALPSERLAGAPRAALPVKDALLSASSSIPSPAATSEPPKLRFIAWQDEWLDSDPRAARHPDGSAVSDAAELELLRAFPPTRLEIKPDPSSRVILLWFSHPHFAQTTFRKVTLLDDQRKVLPPVGRGDFSSATYPAGTHPGEPGWLTYGVAVRVGPNAPGHWTLELHYTAGPLEDARDVEVKPRNHIVMPLQGGSQLNGLGQTPNGKAFVAIAVDTVGIKARRFGATAVTKDGREWSPVDGFAGGSVGASVRIEEFSFAVPLADVAKFRIGTRPIRMREWRDVVFPGADAGSRHATGSERPAQ